MKKLLLTLVLMLTTTMALAVKHIPNPHPTTTKLKIPAFSAIQVVGNVKLIIRGIPSSKSKDTLIESRNPQWVDAKVKRHTLYLRALRAALPSRKPATVIVKMYRLTMLKVYGHASVQGNNIRSNGLVIKANSTGNINLNGKLCVDKIHNKGPGNIRLRRVQANLINIKAEGNGSITLIGKAKKLRAKLEGHATLNAQNLPAQDVMIKTDDYTSAKVLPIKSLSAFATDYSNIYYYSVPKYITRYTRNSGNVLEMEP